MRAAHKLSFISMEIGCQDDRLIARSQLSRKQGFNQSPIRRRCSHWRESPSMGAESPQSAMRDKSARTAPLHIRRAIMPTRLIKSLVAQSA
jgi:hypothetical protein